jgi:hypothetical protein
MEPEECVAFSFNVCENLKGKKNRKWWLHPINTLRHSNGNFYTLYTPL